MNENSEIQKLLHKFILNKCNSEESNEVVAYYRQNKLTDDFPSVEDIQLLVDEVPEMDKAKADAIFSKILIDAKEAKETTIETKKIPLVRYLSIAASILVLVSLGWSYQQGFFQEKNNVVIDPNAITLQLANGDVQ
ncbi:MAG: iron dicitrate transport regulator FecR, partial [Flavobacterium sp.]|nr:iron dicitrate transport regulator FecR [Flavobacterium sp.]